MEPVLAVVAERGGAMVSIATSADATTDDRPELAMLAPATAVGDIFRDAAVIDNVARSSASSTAAAKIIPSRLFLNLQEHQTT